MKKTRIYMGIPSTGSREDSQIYALRRLQQKYQDQIELVYPEIYVGRIFHDFARNEYVKDFLKSDCDILWFLDSDVVPPGNVLDLVTLHGEKWKLAGAPYPVWMTVPGYDGQQVVFTVYVRDPNNGALHASPVPDAGLAFVDGMATGCIFIHREVLEKVPAPWFEFKYDPITRNIIEGEDLGFCKKTCDLGYKFFTDFSMVCHHFKKVSLLDVNNYAMQRERNAIINFERKTRQILARQKLNQAPAKKSNLILPK